MAKLNNLFTLLKERNITQRELGEMINISPGNIGDWKSGKAKPSFDVLIKIAETLEVSIDFLVESNNFPLLTPSEAKILSGASYQKFLSNQIGKSDTVKLSQYFILCHFLKCSLRYLYNAEEMYSGTTDAEIAEKAPQYKEWEALYLCSDILSRRAIDEQFRMLQIQISRIVVHNLLHTTPYKKKNDRDKLKANVKEKCKLVHAKVDFIFNEGKSPKKSSDYGFDWGDIISIVDNFGVSVMVLLAGE